MMIAEPLIPSYVRAIMKPNPRVLEEHLDKVIDVWRWSDEASLDLYLDRVRDELCDACDCQSDCTCSCRLKALIPLAATAIELRGRQDLALANSLSWNDAEMPESD
jgi:hypothetical protein